VRVSAGRHASVIDEDIDTAEFLDQRLIPGVDRRRLAHVERRRADATAQGREFCLGGGEVGFAAGDENQVGACFRQTPGNSQPDAATAAGDERLFAIQSKTVGHELAHGFLCGWNLLI
jgi:hypothetical protein